MDIKIPDISKIAWQLNIALVGAVFSTFSLIYNDKYIYYGFITFLFGVISHFSSTWFEFVYSTEDKRAERARFYYIQTALILIWLVVLFLCFFCRKKTNYVGRFAVFNTRSFFLTFLRTLLI